MATETETTITATDVTTEPDHDDVMPDGLNDGGKAALKAERDARKKAAREASEAKAELDKLRAEKDEADRIKAEQDEAEAVKRGEFEKLATERADTIKTVSGERDDLKAQLDSLVAAIKPDVDAAWQALPDVVQELYEGGADDVLARKAFLASPRIIKLLASLTEKADERRNAHRTPLTPQPNPNAKTFDEAAAKRQQASVSSI